MPFLTSQIDLTNTIFTEDDLQKARAFLSECISREMPTWLNNPQGPFGDYWKRDDFQAACNLIDLYRMIDLIAGKITQQSTSCLYRKVRDDLLRNPPKIQKFYEILTELQVAFRLVSFVSPLTLEPRIPGQTRAPDFAFQLPEGIVYLDVTVFQGGPLERWEMSKEKIRAALLRKATKQNKMLSVYLDLPFENINAEQVINHLLKEIDESDKGEIRVGNKGRIRWEPLPVTIISENSNRIPTIPLSSFGMGVFHPPGGAVRRGVGMHSSIAAPSLEDVTKANESFFKSVISKLKEKHDQFPRNEPSLFVIKLGHSIIDIDRFLNIIQTRIWTKDDFRWITGIILFKPQQGFFKTDEDYKLILSANPKAKCQASESLIAIFRDEAKYHY